MRRVVVAMSLVLALAVSMVAPVSPAQAAVTVPGVIDLPGGFFPEGIAIGRGNTFYTGSLVDGAIYQGDLRTGEGSVLVEGQSGLLSVGMDFQQRSGHLFVAGGSAGTVRVYDTESGSMVADIALGAGFVNDVIVTRSAAYLTNSFAPELYKIPLNAVGQISGPAEVIPLSGDFEFVPGAFNTNGIVFVNPRTLIIVNSSTGTLYRVDPGTGVARAIDTAGAAINGDGLVLVGEFLYAVVGSRNQVTELRLSANNLRARVTDEITSDLFNVPTTADVQGSRLYVVNAKFGTPAVPETPYEVVVVRR